MIWQAILSDGTIIYEFDNGKLNIVTHHWSNHEMKGFDVYEQIDKFVGENTDKFSFTYIGRDRGTFKHTNVIKPLSGRALGKELGKYDVYVSASRFDPGPNHLLESISCGLPTFVHKDGGGCVEFGPVDGLYTSWDDLRDRLTLKQLPTQQNFKFSNWQSSILEYTLFLEQICHSKI